MKRSLTLLLASLLLVFTLTACGRGNQQDTANQNGQNNGAVTENGANDNNGAILDNGPADQNGANGNNNGNSLAGDVEDTVRDGVNEVGRGIEDVGDAITGNDVNRTEGTTNQTGSTLGGATYEQMLRNARVRDTDGILTDYENTVTSGRTY